MGGDGEISVPPELIAVLRWHVETQLRPGPQRESELLVPSEVGGYRSPSSLDKPFAIVAKAIGLKEADHASGDATLVPRPVPHG